MKATHTGLCQACGRRQLLPSGRLSLHGYTTGHGYFAGVCRGAKELPYEQSCALIETFIDEARAALSNVEQTQAILQQPASEPKCWVRPYVRGHHRFRGGYAWMYVTLRQEQKYAHTDQWVDYSFTMDYPATPGEESRLGRTVRAGEADILAVCTEQNQKRADWLEHEAQSLRNYIVWQTQRVNEWVEKPLQPVSEQPQVVDIKAFTPVSAPY